MLWKILLYLKKSEPFGKVGSKASVFPIFENKLSEHKTEETGKLGPKKSLHY